MYTITRAHTRTHTLKHIHTFTQAKLNSLKIYVLELKESYDELLKAFSQLELSSKDSVADMEGVLATKIAAVKVHM